MTLLRRLLCLLLGHARVPAPDGHNVLSTWDCPRCRRRFVTLREDE